VTKSLASVDAYKSGLVSLREVGNRLIKIERWVHPGLSWGFGQGRAAIKGPQGKIPEIPLPE